nr:MAG TPA: hypothetical protein [Caudoviricetes sp.]
MHQNPVNKQLESRNLFYFFNLSLALLVAWLNLMYGRWYISPLFILVINADIK